MHWILVLALALQAADAARIEARQKELASSLKQAKTAEGLNFLAEQYLQLADEAQAVDLYDAAAKAADQAARIAAGTKNGDVADRAKQKGAEIKTRTAEFGKARSFLKVLEEKPDDAAANLAVGKYLCFVKGDWTKGLPLLGKGSDDALKKLASKEELAAAGGTEIAPEVRLELADEWWPRSRDRALHWYKRAWPNLNPLQKEKARERFKEVLFRKPDRPAAEIPAGWMREAPPVRTVLGDSTCSHGGQVSVRLEPMTSKDYFYSGLASAKRLKSAPKRKYVLSCWVLSDGTAEKADLMVAAFDASGKHIANLPVTAPSDTPFWTRLEKTVEMPDGTDTIDVRFQFYGKTGKAWIDDVSLRDDGGTELLENAGLER